MKITSQSSKYKWVKVYKNQNTFCVSLFKFVYNNISNKVKMYVQVYENTN